MSKKDKKQQKLQNFKNKAKKMAEQQKTPKTHLIPQTEWQSTDILDIRGDLLEALEKTLVGTFTKIQELNQEFNKAAKVMQMILSTNIKAEKIKLKYKWNNGEDATPADVEKYESEMAKLQEQQKAQYEQMIAQQKQNQEDAKKNENAIKTGLVDTNGSPIGTTQDLSEEGETHGFGLKSETEVVGENKEG